MGTAVGLSSDLHTGVINRFRTLPMARSTILAGRTVSDVLSSILCGSIVSSLRMRPGNWAGAYVCWGTENREAAVRFVTGGPGSPLGHH